MAWPSESLMKYIWRSGLAMTSPLECIKAWASSLSHGCVPTTATEKTLILWPSNSYSDEMKPSSKANKSTGLAILFISISLFIIYSYFLLASQWGLLLVQVTVLAGVAALAAVMAWIGYTMAIAPRTQADKP
jgi:hypothetical protein